MKSSSEGIQQRIAQGVGAWERDEYDEALRIFDQVLETHATFPDVHNRRGLCLAMMGRQDDALAAFDRAVELAPTYAEAHWNRGIILEELGRPGDAEGAFELAQGLDTRNGHDFPSHVGNEIAVTHARLGDLYRKADQAGLAVDQYQAALQVRPGYVDIRAKLAEAMLETGDAAGARKELETVLETDPGYTAARLRLGVVLQRMGDPEGAVACWERCLEERPGDFRARAYLASVRGPGA